jgi:hypothetical protein
MPGCHLSKSKVQILLNTTRFRAELFKTALALQGWNLAKVFGSLLNVLSHFPLSNAKMTVKKGALCM